MKFKWSRSGSGYEVSTQGDKRFSALVARLPDGRTIEEAYQLDIKGYRSTGSNDWRDGKGKPPIRTISNDALYIEYTALWKEWASANKDLIGDLYVLVSNSNRTLTDMFATSNINQARALCDILNNLHEI